MPNWIKPFHDRNDQEYHYFSIDAITKDVRITQQSYDAGIDLIRSGYAEILIADFERESYYSRREMTGNIRISIYPHQTIEVEFTKDQLLHCRCRSHICHQTHDHNTNGICKHEAAALILMTNYLAENRPGDSTDKDALLFLKQFRLSHNKNNITRTNTVHLIPRLILDEDEISIRLLITTDSVGKAYIVRNIIDLFLDIEAKRTYALGKNTEIKFSKESFADDTAEFAQTIKNWINDKNEIYRDRYYYSDDDIKNHIRLYGDRIDHFFELFADTEVEYGQAKKEKIKLVSANPQICLHIQKLNNGNGTFEGVIVSGEIPPIFHGNKYDYCISDGCMYRMSLEYTKELEPLMSLRKEWNDEIKFQIGRKNLAEFYYTVLPELRKVAAIEESDSDVIEKFLPPEVLFKFYLDIDNGRPECRVGTWYGETGVAIFDLIGTAAVKEEFRDAQREKYVLNIVRQYFPEFRRSEERFLGSEKEDAVYDILENAVPKLTELGDVVCTDRFQHIQVRKKLQISVGVFIENDLLNLEIATEDLTTTELLDILNSYQKKKKYHRLKDGKFVDIDESIAELSAMLDTMRISPKEFVKGKMQIPAYRAFYLDKMLEQSSEIYAKRDTHFKQIIRNMKTISESDFELPESLNKIMRGYQQFGHKWLRTLGNCGFGGILADDMGLGKTLQMISVLLVEKQTAQSGTSLIVCPASLVFNWAAEFEKYAPELNYCIIVGTQKERAELIEQYQNYDVLITSYDLIKRDITHYGDCNFTYQVIDEAQYIKNHTTAAAKSVKLINAKHRFALTGTPIENRLSELWSIFDYLMPGFLYKYEEFKRNFETPIVKRSDDEMTKRLRRMTAPFILRRLKKDVLRDLPDKLEENYVVSLNDEQRHVYDAKVLELRQLLEGATSEGFQTIKLQIFSYLTQIRQICCDPSLLFSDYNGESSKRAACMELVQRVIESEHRVLIFSQFTTMLEILEHDLTESGISYYKITGETSKKKRMELVDSFNKGDTPVFLISLKAGGTGLNLTGADVVIHYDPWWNVAAQNQATDRAHRIGQTRAVTVYKLIAKDTIEEKIQKMQEKKQSLVDSVLTGDFVNLASLSKDELMDILV